VVGEECAKEHRIRMGEGGEQIHEKESNTYHVSGVARNFVNTRHYVRF